MSEMIDLSRPDALERLNAAGGGARFYIGTPEHGLADYTVRDRTLFGQPDVVARHFGLPDVIAAVARLNEEAERETRAQAMAAHLATSAARDASPYAEHRSWALGVGGNLVLACTGVLVALSVAMALAGGGEQLVHVLAGWLPR